MDLRYSKDCLYRKKLRMEIEEIRDLVLTQIRIAADMKDSITLFNHKYVSHDIVDVKTIVIKLCIYEEHSIKSISSTLGVNSSFISRHQDRFSKMYRKGTHFEHKFDKCLKALETRNN